MCTCLQHVYIFTCVHDYMCIKIIYVHLYMCTLYITKAMYRKILYSL